MTQPPDDENKIPKEDETDGKGQGSGGKRSGGSGEGAGALVGGSFRFSVDAQKLKTIMSEWKHLDMAEAVARVAEFFSELPARASANLQVKWDSLNKGGYAVVSQVIAFGQDVSQLLRERTAGNIRRLRTKYGIKVASKPATNPGMT